MTAKELESFREYFQIDILGKGRTPIIGTRGGKGLNVVKLGATNDDGLYLKYQEFVLKMIALAFKLSGRDMNLTDHDNRSTAGIAADATFQKAVRPMGELIIKTLQIEVIDRYFPGYQIKFSNIEPRSEQEEAETATMLYEKGILTQNEARFRAGEKPIGPNGDKFFSAQGQQRGANAAVDAS